MGGRCLCLCAKRLLFWQGVRPEASFLLCLCAAAGKVCLTLATLEGEEKFDAANLGSCAEVVEERVGDWDYLFFRGCVSTRASTIILRVRFAAAGNGLLRRVKPSNPPPESLIRCLFFSQGANEFMLDEVERSVHDALCAVSRCLSSSAVCPGGGAVEAALSVYLEDFARTLGSREQLAVAAFAEALLVIPKTLALNAALDATDICARLRAAHALLQQQRDAQAAPGSAEAVQALWGIDLLQGKLCRALPSGIVEASMSKTKSLKFATEAAVTILRIDDFIRIAPEPERKERD